MQDIISTAICSRIDHLKKHQGQHVVVLVDDLEAQRSTATPAETEAINLALDEHRRSVEKRPEDMHPFR